MPLVAIVLVAAILVGYIVGGRLHRIEKLRLRWWGLAPLGLAMQAIPLSTDSHGIRLLGVSLLIGSFPILITFVARNIRVPGMALILVGLVMNLTVIAANRGMPITRHAVLASGQGKYLDELPRHHGAKHFLARDEDIVLKPLADVIPLGSPVNDVVSAGDCVVYAGMFWLIVAAMRGRRIPSDPRPSRAEADRS
ncbi:MAG: DUF5317 family protein [Actinomycetota bacterium]